MCFSDEGKGVEVFSDVDFQELEDLDPLHSSSIDVDGSVIKDQLLCLADVEPQVFCLCTSLLVV